VVKEGGRARATVTLCKLDNDNKVVYSGQKEFPNGKETGQKRTYSLDNKGTRILAINRTT